MRCAACALVLAACAQEAPAPAAPAPIDTLIAVNGTRLFVHREGAGPPLVVIHGGPLLDHGHLLEPLRPLGDDADLVFFDQRLSGRSDGRVDSASVRLDTFAADVEAIRVALGLGPIHVLGHSWGGLIALRHALAHPDAVRSLILISPMPPSSVLWQQGEAQLAASLEPEDTAGMGALRADAGFARGEPAAIEAMLKLAFRSQFHDPAGAARLSIHIADDYAERSRQFSFLAGDLTAYDLTPQLPALTMPVLVMYGSSEVGVRAGIEALAAGLPDATVVPVEEAGHFAFIEAPERVRDLLRDWLAANSR